MNTHETKVLPMPCMHSTKLYILAIFVHYTYALFMVFSHVYKDKYPVNIEPAPELQGAGSNHSALLLR